MSEFDGDSQENGGGGVNPLLVAALGLAVTFFLYQFVGAGLVFLLFGLDFTSANPNLVRLMNSAVQVLFLLLPALVLAKHFFNSPTILLSAHPVSWKYVALFGLGMTVVLPLISSLGVVILYAFQELARVNAGFAEFKLVLDELNTQLNAQYKFLLGFTNPLDMAIIVFVVAFTPAVAEEFLFRGFFMGALGVRLSAAATLTITSFIFAFLHFHPYGFLPLLVLSFYFGYALLRSGSILIPMLLHGINNLVSVLLVFFGIETPEFSTEAISYTDFTTSLFALLVLTVIAVVFVFGVEYGHRNGYLNTEMKGIDDAEDNA